MEDNLFKAGWFALAVGLAAVILYFRVVLNYFEISPCLFSTYLHIYCPGCGGTRAVSALLQGHILESVWCHPIVLYTVLVFGGFMLTQSLERLGLKCVKGWKFHNWHLYGAIVIVVCNFLIKNLLRWIWGITI